MASELKRLSRAMCSLDLADSQWTQELPRLPVPDLWLTAARYLASLRAVLAPSGSGSNSPQPNELLGWRVGAEESAQMRQQFERTELIVKQFMLDEGLQLQRDLKEYANKCQNWATEYWLQDMYLRNPLPLPVNSNPFFMFPRQQFNSSYEMLMFATRIIQFSVDFKYRIDQQTLKQDVGSGHGKGKPLCMATYKNFFHSYRMPHEDMDRLLPQSRRSNHIVVASCDQFFILRLGQEPLIDPYKKEESSLLNEACIFDQLLRIYRISRENAKRELKATSDNETTSNNGHLNRPKVGLFTTENRKTWAKLHKKLTHCSPPVPGDGLTMGATNLPSDTCARQPTLATNIESLRQIEDCLFVMCLDSLVTQTTPIGATSNGGEGPTNPPAAAAAAPAAPKQTIDGIDNEEQVRAANIILTGGGSHLFTANRWFDKFLQIIVGRDGVCGINIEHSASEGITVLRFLVEFLEFIKANPITDRQAPIKSTFPGQFDETPPAPQGPASVFRSITSAAYEEPKSPQALLEETDRITALRWFLDEELTGALDEAHRRADKLVASFSLCILSFNHFGCSLIKGQNLSPDAFVQLALQYTFYQLHGRLASTYESASLRQFRLGRVDNIRANTCEAFDWIQAMLRCKRQEQETTATTDRNGRWGHAEASFERAIAKQVEILRYTIVGGAPDNHLLALKELAHIRYDDELPQLFTDPSYREFLNFRLSTSQLPNESGITVGYGPVVPDGYGCSYNPCAEALTFCVSSSADCPETSSPKFAATLQASLLEMRDLCLGRKLEATD